MAIETERDPRLYAVEDDPMRAAVVRNGARPLPLIADPAPLGLAAFGLTLLTTAVVSLMLFLLTLSFSLLGIGDAGPHSELVKIGGWFGLASAAVALHGAFASVINTTVERTLVPLVPLRRVHSYGRAGPVPGARCLRARHR
jgi:succinate-acetate transporter protein